MARVARLTDRVHELEVDAFRTGVNRSFAVVYSHFEENVKLDVLSGGYADGWTEGELEDIESQVEPLSRALADRMARDVLHIEIDQFCAGVRPSCPKYLKYERYCLNA